MGAGPVEVVFKEGGVAFPVLVVLSVKHVCVPVSEDDCLSAVFLGFFEGFNGLVDVHGGLRGLRC